MTPPPERNQLFISYSHVDRGWVERLQTMIRPLVRSHGLRLWDDSQIQPGDKWREEIETALAAAKVALLLVSSDFLASEFVNNSELPQLLTAAEEEGLRILWVPLRPSLVRHTSIEAYQALLDPGRPLAAMNPVEQDEALVEIALAIQEALATRQDSPPPMRLLRWPARTQVFYEKLGDTASLTMVRIPAGSFQMGSAEQEPGRHVNEGPVNTVTLAEFLIGQTPITQAQWRAVARWTPQQGERWGRELNPEPAKFQGEEARLLAGETNTDGRPVERVSWLEAIEFCSRLSQRTGRNYTLPSEAQWEYACRAGTSTAYCFGAIIYTDLANFRGTDASRFSSPAPDPQPLFREQTTPAGMFPANAWGLYDMHGNVSEWCLDSVRSRYEGGPYDGSAWEDPQAPKLEQRITRGGSWYMPPRSCRSAFRFPFRLPFKADVPDGLYDDVGFRLVCLPKSVSGQKSNPQELDRGLHATVLWVDDNHDNNRSERSELEKLGIKVLQAGSTEEAHAVLLDQPIDAIISDMLRHGRPRAGLELLQEIKARGRSIPVVFYMGVKRPELEAEAMELGAAAVINQRDQLYVIVKSILSKR